MLLQNIIVCNMEVPHFESGIWQVWWSVSLVYHFISMPFHKVIWRYHFNLTPFYKFIISFTDTSILIPVKMAMFFNFYKFQFDAISKNWDDIIHKFPALSLQQELSSDTLQQSEWKQNARERGLEHLHFYERKAWVIAHWTYELITHTLLHTKRLWGFPPPSNFIKEHVCWSFNLGVNGTYFSHLKKVILEP